MTITPKGSGDLVLTTGDVSITSGNVLLPTTSSTVGQILVNAIRWAHSFGASNIFLGQNAGNFTLAGATENIGIGSAALQGLTSGDANIGIGPNSLIGLTSGGNNVCVGSGTMQIYTTAVGNSAFGFQAMLGTGGGTSAIYNVAVGYEALKVTNGSSYNTIAGTYAADAVSTGSYNVAIGANCLTELTTGDNNVAIGTITNLTGGGSALTGADHSNIMIMNVGVAGDVHTTRIGTQGNGAGQQNLLYAAGAYGVTPGGTINVALVDSNGQFGSVASLGVPNGGTGVATLLDHGLLVGSGTAAIDSIGVGASGTVLIGNTTADPSFSANPTVSTIYATTFDTNIAAAAVTLAGTTLAADGTDLNIDINITPKGTGKLVTTELTLVTDLAVQYGGTGASTFTDHGLLVGSGASAIDALSVGGTGVILTGVAGSDPTWTTATYPATVARGDVLVASADNVIGVQAGATTAGYVLTANGAATAPTFQAPAPGGLTWSIKTVDLNPMIVDNGYIANKAGLLTFTLPTTCAVGKVLRVTGMNTAVGWRIAQSASQIIHFGTSTTTTGVGGYIEATNIHDSVELVCCVADLEFIVVSSTGNITIA